MWFTVPGSRDAAPVTVSHKSELFGPERMGSAFAKPTARQALWDTWDLWEEWPSATANC
jgi:hypothetical protein